MSGSEEGGESERRHVGENSAWLLCLSAAGISRNMFGKTGETMNTCILLCIYKRRENIDEKLSNI